MADSTPPVLREITVTFGVESGRLIVRVKDREHFVTRVADADRANLVLDELERWIVYRVGNAAHELAGRLRSPAFASGPVTDPSRSPEKR